MTPNNIPPQLTDLIKRRGKEFDEQFKCIQSDCDGECNHDDCCGKAEANCPLNSIKEK